MTESNKKLVNEKTVEILFNRYFLSAFGLRNLKLFAPTSVKEYRLGYDAKFVGHKSLREVYLQFKAPTRYSDKHNRFTIRITEHQHELLKKYHPDSAYYVAPMFRSFEELNEVESAMTSSEIFLRFFACIEISNLPDSISYFHIKPPDKNKTAPDARYNLKEDPNKKNARHPVKGKDLVLLGNWLLNRLKDKKVGAVLDTSNEGISEDLEIINKNEKEVSNKNVWNPRASGAFQTVDKYGNKKDFGVMLRAFE